MTTTIEPEGDPTFLAYERARQFGESTLQKQAEKGQARAAEDVQSGGLELAATQANALEDSKNSLRARGFGSVASGPRAVAENRIRQDIAFKVQELLRGYQRTSTDITDDMTTDLALSRMEAEEQALAARGRLTRANAQSGVGI